MADIKLKPLLQIVNGIRVPRIFKAEGLKEVMEYKPNPDDVFIVTYPKCGTTWMQIVALYIFRKGKEVDDYGEFDRLCPFIDPRGLKGIANMLRPGALKTHLPYNLMPYSPDSKYIFVMRNPKDTCVSLFYHAKSCKGFEYSEGVFDDFFELFIAGEVEYGDYFDHLQSWYPHRNDKEVFNTTYEDMKEDLKSIVIRLAAFLGQEYTDAIEKDNNVLRNILQFSDFEYMKNHLAKSFDSVRYKGNEASPETDGAKTPKGVGKSHFRKGIVGDWQTHFSVEQSERLNQKFFDRFGGTEIYEKYKPYL